MGEWTVAAGLLEGPEGLLLVQNRRRDGALDWSPPGGVVEVADGEAVVDGLTREVLEETGLSVHAWEGPIYEVEAAAEGLGWTLKVEVHRAVSWTGELLVDDPDGIVVDARFVRPEDCGGYLDGCHAWVREPLAAWVAERWVDARRYRYRVDGTRRDDLRVTRL